MCFSLAANHYNIVIISKLNFQGKWAPAAYEKARVSGLRQRVTLISDRETELLGDSRLRLLGKW